MAVITTDEQFRLAAGVWIPANPGTFQGTPFIDAAGRKIYDERPALVDVTPSTAVLEAALDTANATVADDTTVSASAEIALTAKRYLRDRLRTVNPNLGTIFNQMKTYIDSNAQLLLMLNNNIDVMALAHGWNAANVRNATGASTNQIKAQYVVSAMGIVGVVS
jgi:hypothetical protein